MDKLSNKLRLVRSQSMGVGMGGVAVHPDKMPVMRRTPSHADGRTASIVLLDERRLEMLIQPRLYAGELLDLVASHCQLKEKEYFGLAVVDDSGHYTWLQLDRKVLDHDLPRKPQTLTVHFLVKFFIESIAHLSDNKTIELFCLQARSLIFRGTLEVESDIVFQLAALSLQGSHGDFIDDLTTRSLIKKSPILPATVLKENASMTYCEDQVIDHHKKMNGQTRGQAVVNYMTIVESMPTYGVHYFEVYDKRQTPWWLGLSCKGIAQYSYNDRKVPVRVFPWKQLENLYFRDKKFSIEVHDAKRVVQTLSSFNLYEDALKLDSGSQAKDELVDAIADSTTQVSVSRRSFNPGSIHVYVWFGKTQGLTKCIWQSAISQHQFYLDRKQAKMRHNPQRTLKEIARDLSRSTASLSSASSLSNLSRSESTHSLAGISTGAGSTLSGSRILTEETMKEQSEEAKRARMEMIAALKARREALEAKLKDKEKQLKEICIKEGELTGELPPETPLAPGEPPPQIRRRMGTEFALSEDLLRKKNSPEEEQLTALELEYEIQSKITSAALKLANDSSAPKSVRKQRKISYQQTMRKFREIENKLNKLKSTGANHHSQIQRRHRSTTSDLSPDPRQSYIRRSSAEDIRRGISVPDLDAVSHRQTPPNGFMASIDDVDGFSPRSCPNSPRKIFNNQKPPDSISLEHPNPHRAPIITSGYIPSSVYLRSSYRAKQFPTLSTNSSKTPLLATTEKGVDSSGRSATLPTSPFRNKYEDPRLTQCDSPVGLYNIPQQRTSQAFSSLDDIDALTTNTLNRASALNSGSNISVQGPQPPPKATSRSHLSGHFGPMRMGNSSPSNQYPSLERAMRKRQPGLNPLMANRELPALPKSSSPTVRSSIESLSSASLSSRVESARSMEDLESLEASGFRGHSKMQYREVMVNGNPSSTGSHHDPLDPSLMADAMSKMNLSSRPHHLRNNEEYPPHYSPSSSTNSVISSSGVGSSKGSHHMLGIRPLETGGPYPSSHAKLGTLLPGQTYPEPSAKPLAPAIGLHDVFYQHHKAISEALSPTPSQQQQQPPSSSSSSGGACLSHSPSMSSSTSSVLLSQSKRMNRTNSVQEDRHFQHGSEAAPPPPPPLFPKQQYYQAQRRRSGMMGTGDLPLPIQSTPQSANPNVVHSSVLPVPPRSVVSESPAVNRKVKPIMATPPSSSATSTKSVLNDSFDSPLDLNVSVPISSPSAVTDKHQQQAPFRNESTKPFEMSDFYKYSTKFRKPSVSATSTSSSKSGETNNNTSVGDISEGMSDSPRSSTASGSSSSNGGAPPMLPAKSPKKLPPPSNHTNGDLGDDFSSEMLAWYNAQQKQQGPHSNGTKGTSAKQPHHPNSNPATLV